jgi:Fe-S cluster biogenesis protein NfuA
MTLAAVAGSLEPAVRAALDDVRPRIHAHHGDVVIREITEDGVVRLAFQGNCVGCPFQLTTLGAALIPRLMQVPGVTDVQLDGRQLPPAVMRRIAQLSLAQPA